MQREGAGWESGDPYAVHPGKAGPPLCAAVCSSVKWGDERTELAPLCGSWPGEPSPQPRGSLRRRGPGGLWGAPGYSSNPPSLSSSGQPAPLLAPCSRASVSSSHARRATASSPPRMGRRTSSCTYLSESRPPPPSRWFPPTFRSVTRPRPQRPPSASRRASPGLSPHRPRSVLLALPPLIGAGGTWGGEGWAGEEGRLRSPGNHWLGPGILPSNRGLRGLGQPLAPSAWKGPWVGRLGGERPL